MIYPIYVYGSAILRTESEAVERDFPELNKLIDNMFETMYNADGVGLAAPQIGKNIRLFVIDISVEKQDEESENSENTQNMKMTFINPEIYERSDDEILFSEGCLSVPGVHEDVSRPTSIKIRYMDENFVEHDCEFSGFAARVIQHEYDHIEQKLFVDHLSPLRKTLLKSKLNAMTKGKYNASYKTR